MNMCLLSRVLLFAFLFGGCATPVLDLPEPTTHQFAEARRLLDHDQLFPVASYRLPQRDWESYANASAATVERVRNAVARFCGRTHLGRCDKFSTFPKPTLVHDLETVNAYADHQDRVTVYTGLMDKIGVRGELGAVLAHEYAHVLLGHSKKKQTNMLTGGAVLLGLMGGLAAATGRNFDPSVYQNATDLGMFLGSRAYSPEMELEADRLAVYILDEANYSIRAMRDALIRLHRTKASVRSSGTSARVGFLETHPSSPRRIAHMLTTIEDVKAEVPWRGTTDRVVVED